MALWIMQHAGPIYHVHPVGDLIGHELDPDCICGPTVKPVLDDKGAIAVMHFHRPLDDRTDRKS